MARPPGVIRVCVCVTRGSEEQRGESDCLV